MSFSLTWMPRVLEEAGLKVALVPGWESRGRAEMGRLLGVMCHHTAGPRRDNMPSLRTLVEGRAGISGPLAQLGLGRDGTFYVVAAGRCNHAGKGLWQGLSNGNTNFIGIEAENTGLPNDTPWPVVQLDAYRRGVAALLKNAGREALFCVGHREYALPKGRKPDPNFDMDAFRRDVAALMSGETSPLPLIPAIEPTVRDPVTGPRPTLRRGATGELVKTIQKACGAAADGSFGAHTEAAVRAFQRARSLVPDGIVGPKTWILIDGAEP